MDNELSSSFKESFMEEQLKKSQLPPEVEKGNVEYKLHLVNPSPERLEHLISQMKWRYVNRVIYFIFNPD